MICKRIQKSLPLLVGNELAVKEAARVYAHLDECADCRKEEQEFAAARQAAQVLARADEPEDWDDAEWLHLLQSITLSKIEKKKALPGLSLKPVLASALALLVIAAGAFFFLKRPSAPPDARATLQPPSQDLIAPARKTGKQDVPSMTIISKETGLKIIWFFNKNFEAEGFGK
jgi:anti-sigma factor RsiW